MITIVTVTITTTETDANLTAEIAALISLMIPIATNTPAFVTKTTESAGVSLKPIVPKLNFGELGMEFVMTI